MIYDFSLPFEKLMVFLPNGNTNKICKININRKKNLDRNYHVKLVTLGLWRPYFLPFYLVIRYVALLILDAFTPAAKVFLHLIVSGIGYLNVIHCLFYLIVIVDLMVQDYPDVH